MKPKVDMTYSFLWDSEPTDEQLEVIMQEVADEAKEGKKIVEKLILENIQKESDRIKSEYNKKNDKQQ